MTDESPSVSPARWIDLERADARREALHDAIRRIENLDGNELYQKAWKTAVKAIKSLLVLEEKREA